MEVLRGDFQDIAAKYIWGSKKVQKIKKPFNHYFTTVAEYFLCDNYNMELIDSVTYKKALLALVHKSLYKKEKRREELILLRNFLGGLTNYKIMELFRAIKVETFEKEYQCSLDKKEKLIYKVSMRAFEKKLSKYSQRILSKTG